MKWLVIVLFLVLTSCSDDDTKQDLFKGAWSFTNPNNTINASFVITGLNPNYTISNITVNNAIWNNHEFRGIKSEHIEQIIIREAQDGDEGIGFFACTIVNGVLHADSVVYQKVLEKTMYYNQVLIRN